MIKELFAELDHDQREAIMIAFNNLTAHYIKLSDNRFIGVHLTDAPELIIDHTEGFWSLGRLK